MKTNWKKFALPFVVLLVGVGAVKAINASAEKEEDKQAVDTRPTVKVESIESADYQVLITSFGEVTPLESTAISSQVAGEVTAWNENFVAGGLVLRGETLFSIEKDTYEAALLQAEANLSSAQSLLIEEQARANVAKQEAKNLPNNKVSDLYLRKPQVLSAEAAVKSAQARLKIAQRDLDNCEIKAPYDALVISRNVGVGQYVNQGAQVAVLNNVEKAEIVFPIAGFDNAFLPNDVAGTPAIITTKGFDAITRKGAIARDLGVVDQATRMSQLVIRIDDPYGIKSNVQPLKYGSYVEVQFVGKTLPQVYRLPQELVTNRTVWIVNQDNKLEPRKVDIVREEGAYFLISEGLSNTDKIVVTLPEYPQKGMEVKTAKPKPASDDSSLSVKKS
ncbi:MAG: efflux RND transporter periplasmic adaptor subunit [Paraglaciecola sp.]|uniref:efflux RND transporter periplasmic adaptor subunit n=1 Tax=Paraglaciecola sp. TaxID=1920173 RepID=UPI00273E24C8|nr:efflux RND transporter periplasmic adaptor subunit [Paraglaciecola sp.]MDP5029623.1 efflux RND transporter periplasmic adaptor subunit [Paraglaciecola sp.]MDP5133247.1 efflux RND transporter periplasmic adaptor subunit [Paraglaciecola sp.]